MDRLDRISLWAIVILIIGSSGLISHNMGEAKPQQNSTKRQEAPANPDAVTLIKDELQTVKNMMERNNQGKAELLLRDLILRYPYEAEPRMLMGDMYMRKQEPVKAVLEYKEAVELNPDYLDRKTPLFQGKKLKIVVKEALENIETRLKASPDDGSLNKERKLIYILQRRIAGSCA